MKLISTLIFALGVTYSSECVSQSHNLSRTQGFSAAVSAGMYGYDSGVGIEFGTPSFLKGRLCVRVKGHLEWLEEYKARYDHWAKYESVGTSLVYNTAFLERSRVYFELGTFFIFPDKQFSEVDCTPGTNASIGVELFVVNRASLNISYYFSGGISHSKTYAEKLENNPRYANGFIFSNGLRFYF